MTGALKGNFEPIPEDRHYGRQRQEVAAMRLLRLPGFDPTASKIFCSPTALAIELDSRRGTV
jgi:hypothetical protein